MSGSATRITNNQITVATIDYTRIASGTLVGSLFNPNLTLNSNVSILGNFSVQGNTETINATNTYINDPLVVFNNGYTGSLAGYDIGIVINRNLASLGPYGSVNTFLGWVESDQAFEALATTNTGGNVQSINNSGFANVKIGNLTSVSANITGTVLISGNTAVNNTLYAQGVYDNGVRVASTSGGAGNLSIVGGNITLPLSGPGNLAVTGSSTQIPVITTDAYGRILTMSNTAVSTTVTLAGTSGSGSFAGGGTLTFASTNGVTIAVGTNYANISTPQDLRVTATPTFNGLYSNVGASSLSISGNTIISNTGIISLGSIANLQVTGGATGYAVTTNGTGTLSFSAANVIVLGANASGQLVSNAVTLTSTTDVTDAIAQLNAILGKLTPSSPPNFPATTLTQSTATTTGLMASFTQTDNSGWGNLSVSGGTSTNAVRVATFATSTVTNSGTTPSGGNIQLYINGVVPPSNFHALTSTPTSADNGTYGNLVVSGVQDYHNIVSTVAAGFWNVFSASVAATSIPAGWNRANIFYTGDAAATPTLTWYYDSSAPTAPAFSATSIALSSNVVSYSSTIPHLNSSAGFTINGTVQNLSGDMYYSAWTSTAANFFSSLGAGGALLAPANRTLAQVGVPVPLTRNNTSAYSFSTTSNVTTGFGSAVATAGPSVSVSTPYATTSSGTFQPGNIILYKTNTTNQIEETSLTSSYGTAARITNPDGGTAADTPAYTGTETTFNSQTSALLATDATVVAAKLQYDVTNYSTGYYPVGPNLSSGRASSQYFTFKFNYAALSSFYIHYTGTLAGLWIACPGVTDTPASPTNGWLNAAAAYAGSGVPGTGTGGNGSNGCAVGGTATLNSNGTYNINVTFGSVNTSSAGNKSNEVYVRVKLTSGQSLTVLTVQSS